MKIKLLDYANNSTTVDVGDTDKVVINVITGDMVMTYPFYKDSSDCRNQDIYDGSVTIYKKDFDKLNSIEESYDIFNIEDIEKEYKEYSLAELLEQISECL